MKLQPSEEAAVSLSKKIYYVFWNKLISFFCLFKGQLITILKKKIIKNVQIKNIDISEMFTPFLEAKLSDFRFTFPCALFIKSFFPCTLVGLAR